MRPVQIKPDDVSEEVWQAAELAADAMFNWYQHWLAHERCLITCPTLQALWAEWEKAFGLFRIVRGWE
jgi:hypothetical protein